MTMHFFINSVDPDLNGIAPSGPIEKDAPVNAINRIKLNSLSLYLRYRNRAYRF